jgi:murein DD-endopeptidase MepM/ murein hydrolase activator NlpD
MAASTVVKYGSLLKVNFSDNTTVLAYPLAENYFYASTNNWGLELITLSNNTIILTHSDYSISTGYQTSNSELWIITATSTSPTGGGGSGTPTPGGPWEWPLNTSLWTISSPYGPRTYPYNRFHYGVDITGHGINGVDVWAISDGVVSHSSYDIYGGNTVHIDHADNSRSYYDHFIAPSSTVVGQALVKGQVIGNVGSTGDSTGAHLHFETHKPPGTPVDPIIYMRERGHEFGEVQTT